MCIRDSFGAPQQPQASSVISQKPAETQKPTSGGFSFGASQQPQASSVISQKPADIQKPTTGGFGFGAPQQPQASSVISQKPAEPQKPATGEFSFGAPQQPHQTFTPNKTLSSAEKQSQLPVVSISTNPISVQTRASVAEGM